MGVLPALLVSLVAASPSSARREADRLAAQAKSDRIAGNFKAALDEATQAYRVSPRPTFLFEIAEDYRCLGQWPQAQGYYERFLATHPSGGARATARRRLAESRAHAAAAGDPLTVAPLAVASLTPNAPAPAGPLEAAPLVAAPLASATPPPVAQPPPVVEAPAPSTSGEVAQSAPAHRSHTLAYTLLGVAGASAIVAVIGWANVASYDSFAGNVPAGTSGPDAKSRQSQAQTWWDVGLATTIIAAAAGGAVAFTW